MSKPILTQMATSLVALNLIAACATTPATGPEAADADAAPKPTPEDIAVAERADPLTRANFWNTHYNAHPTDLDIALAFSKSLRGIGSYERASEVAQLIAVSHPDSYNALMEIGRAEQGKNNLLGAVQAFARAAELDPNSATPYAAVGALYDQQGEHAAAQQAYREALLRDPNRPATLSNYGLSLALEGNLVDAETKLRKAAGLPGATAQVRQNFALVLGLQGKFDEAREIAAIDAPEGVAEQNMEFLARLIGRNERLEQVSKRMAAPPSETPVAARPARKCRTRHRSKRSRKPRSMSRRRWHRAAQPLRPLPRSQAGPNYAAHCPAADIRLMSLS